MKTATKRAAVLSAAVAGAIACSTSTQAATMWWDSSNASGLNAGNGHWRTSGGGNNGLKWATSATPGTTAPGAWVNGSDAIFSASGTSVVDLQGAGVTVNSIMFTGTGYTVSGASVVTLVNTGAGFGTITADQNASFDAPLVGAVGLTKAGAGTLTFGGATASNYTGATTVKAGTLLLNRGHTAADNYSVTGLVGSGNATLGGSGTINLAAAKTVTLTGADSSNKAVLAAGGSAGATGTFTIGQAANTGANANSVTFNNNSRLAVDVNGAAVDLVDIKGNLVLNSGSEVAFNTIAAPTLGRYRIVDYTGTRGGTFTTATNVPTNYLLDYNNTDTAVDLRRRATIGTITATPASATIITGGSTAVGFTVQNSAPVNSFDLNFSATAGTNTTGSASGSVAAGSTGSPTSNTLTFTGTTVGNNQAGSFSLADAAATNSPQAGNFTVNVLDHSNASFSGEADDNADTIDFGTVYQGSSQSAGFSLHNLLSLAGSTARLDLDLSPTNESGDTSNKFSTDLASFTNLLAGSDNDYTVTFDTTDTGTFSALYTLNFSDEDLPGSTGGQVMTLNVTGTVIPVPEPTSLALLGLISAGLLGRRRRSAAV